MPTAARRCPPLPLLFGLAAASAACSFVTAFVGYVVLEGLFMAHGPNGLPIVPSWIAPTVSHGPIVFTSGMATFTLTDSRRVSLWSNVLLGCLAGGLLALAWLAMHWAQGSPFSAYDPFGYLVPVALGTGGSLLGTGLRRFVSRNNPYWSH